MNATILVEFDTEWLVAGGEATLGTADLAPVRDADGFPVVPGRSLRGVLREAVAMMDDCRRLDDDLSWAVRLFGRRLSAAGSEEETYAAGSVRIGNAVVVREVAECCRTHEDLVDLYASVRRTALDERRTAAKHTLRELEVCIPGLVLAADVDVPTSEALRVLAFACGLVRAIGHGRSRGLGRCRLSVVHEGRVVTATSLPGPAEAVT